MFGAIRAENRPFVTDLRYSPAAQCWLQLPRAGCSQHPTQAAQHGYRPH